MAIYLLINPVKYYSRNIQAYFLATDPAGHDVGRYSEFSANNP
jgi:hypothetical protein